jgi:hypothetical protein
MDYYSKYLKYKNKYLSLKRNIVGGNDIINDETLLLDCWIASSHNTYLSGKQLFDGDAKVVCYTDFLELYKGGCVEIDLQSVVDISDNKDFVVSHGDKYISLSKIYLRNILNAINTFIDNNKDLLGPIILSIDNKRDTRKKEEYDLFWKILQDTGINNKLYPINQDYNALSLTVGQVKGKVLIKWNECDCENECKIKNQCLTPPSSGYFKSTSRWTHLNRTDCKSHTYNNDLAYNNLNKNLERKFHRSYPSALSIDSNNYPIIGPLLHGVNMVALNHQCLDRHQLMMREIFKEGCLRKMPQSVIKRNGFKKITITFNILPTDVKIEKIVHPDGETEIKIKNNSFELKDFYEELPVIYIRCNKSNEKYYGAETLKLTGQTGQTDVKLHKHSTKVSSELKCDWPHNLNDSDDNIQLQITTRTIRENEV